MRNVSVLIGIGALILVIGAIAINKKFTPANDTEKASMETLTLTSPAFANSGDIPSQFTCDAEDISPALSWTGAPAATKSLALIMDDPDATNGTWVHWIVFNMPPTLERIEEGKEPEGVAGNNSWGRGGWGGPCPPSGTHRYFFKLYALDTMLDLPEGANKQQVLAAMEGRILAQAELMGKYKRP